MAERAKLLQAMEQLKAVADEKVRFRIRVRVRVRVVRVRVRVRVRVIGINQG